MRYNSGKVVVYQDERVSRMDDKWAKDIPRIRQRLILVRPKKMTFSTRHDNEFISKVLDEIGELVA
jgi:hypothetical protein